MTPSTQSYWLLGAALLAAVLAGGMFFQGPSPDGNAPSLAPTHPVPAAAAHPATFAWG